MKRTTHYTVAGPRGWLSLFLCPFLKLPSYILLVEVGATSKFKVLILHRVLCWVSWVCAARLCGSDQARRKTCVCDRGGSKPENVHPLPRRGSLYGTTLPCQPLETDHSVTQGQENPDTLS